MPILILGGIVIISLVVYIIMTEHKEWFVRQKEDTVPPNDPFNVIYLPADLEEEKAKQPDNEKTED